MMHDEEDYYDDAEAWEEPRKSKSQRQRELHALLALTERALTLTDEKLAATGLNEKALQGFGPVGGTTDKAVLLLGIIIQMHHPRSLLGVGCCNNAIQEFFFQSGGFCIAFAVIYCQREKIERVFG